MLLLLFNGHTEPAVAIADAVNTAPAPAHGYQVDRPASSGVWRFVLELGDPAQGEHFGWHDITQFYAGDSYQRGADEYLGRYRAAVANVQLQTDSDELAPWGQDTSSLFGVDVPLDGGLLMRLGMIRVESSLVVEWNPLWTGRVETWGDASAARGQIRTHVVTVTDVIADLANVPTVVDTGGGLSFADFLTETNWLFGVDSYGDTDVVIPFDLNAVNAINRMDGGADPFGYVWRSRRTGRLLTYPAPWDTTNVARWSNPLLDSYPSGLVFSFSPDFTDIEYIADDDAQPFGVERTSLGVLNSFTVTTPADLWIEDDPVSGARYGVRPFVTTWVGAGLEQVVIDLLNARAYSSAQALPLRTTLDHEGFWSAMAIVDHLDPVTVIHATTDDGLVVTAPGTIRNVTEDRTVRGIDDDGVRLLTWQSTVQIDITSTTSSSALLPVEDLAFLGGDSPLLGGPSSAQFSWVNPTQPDITPTEVQVRVLGRSLIWVPKSYPGVGADGVNIGFLNAATTYTLQVRLVRRVAGVIVAFSASRQVTFTTPAIIIPIFVPDGDSTDVIVGEPPDFTDDCVLEVELQENDGTGWTTIESYTQSDLVQNPDGTWSLIYPVPNSTFVNDRIYRFRSREVCGGIDGQWFTGSSFDPPDDWTDPCTDPPAIAAAPYSDATLLVYVPKVCQGDDVVEYVSGVTGVKGDAFDGFVQMLDQPDRIALLAISDPGWSTAPAGILAYGECDQINGQVGSKTIGVFTAIVNNDACVLVECANMQITCGPGSGSNWQAGASVTTPSGVISLISGDIATGVDGVNVAATFNAGTGDFKLYVNGSLVDSDTFGAATNTSVALPIWRVGAPPESWVTDCALWSRVLAAAELPGSSNPVVFVGAIGTEGSVSEGPTLFFPTTGFEWLPGDYAVVLAWDGAGGTLTVPSWLTRLDGGGATDNPVLAGGFIGDGLDWDVVASAASSGLFQCLAIPFSNTTASAQHIIMAVYRNVLTGATGFIHEVLDNSPLNNTVGPVNAVANGFAVNMIAAADTGATDFMMASVTDRLSAEYANTLARVFDKAGPQTAYQFTHDGVNVPTLGNPNQAYAFALAPGPQSYAPVNTISYVGAGADKTGSGTTITPDLPAGLNAGDMLVATCHARDNVGGSFSAEAGWQMVGMFQTHALDPRVFFKRALGGGLDTNPTFDCASSSTMEAKIYAYRNVAAVVSVKCDAGLTLTPPRNTPVDNCVSLAVCGANFWPVTALGTANGYTLRGNATQVSSGSISLADKTVSTAGAPSFPVFTQSGGPSAEVFLAYLIPS